MVTQRRCGFARDDRLGVNRGRFFSLFGLRHLDIWKRRYHFAAALWPFRSGAVGLSTFTPPLSRGMDLDMDGNALRIRKNKGSVKR